tara:strand:+ start:9159 stop:11465 length:2307 start_codon:yes stop_codon:yes gene_type:complete
MATDTAIAVELRLQDMATKELKQFSAQTRKQGAKAEKAFRGVAKEARKVKLSVAQMAGAAAVAFSALKAGQSIIGAGLGFVKAASDAEEALAKFGIVFGAEADRVRETLEGLAKATGRSKYEFIEFAAGLQDLFVPLGFTRKEASQLSIAMVALSTDISSFSNTDTAEVIRDIKGALAGSSETVRKYGAVLSAGKIEQEAYALGLADVGEGLDDVAKAAAVTSLIIKSTRDAQGDAARTGGSWANTLRAINAEISVLKVEVGKFVKDELLVLIQSFGSAEEIGQKLKEGFALIGAITVAAAKGLAGFVTSAIAVVDGLGGLSGVIEVVQNVGTAIEFAFRRLAARIPLIIATIKAEFLAIKLAFVQFGVDFANFTNTLGKLPGFGNIAQKDIGKIMAAGDGAAMAFLDAAEAVRVLRNEQEETIKQLGADQAAAEGRSAEFAAKLAAGFKDISTEASRFGETLGNLGVDAFFSKAIADMAALRAGAKAFVADLGNAAPQFGAEGGATGNFGGFDAPGAGDAALAAARAEQDQRRMQIQEIDAVTDANERQKQSLLDQGDAVYGLKAGWKAYTATLSNAQLSMDLVAGATNAIEGNIGNLSRDLVDGKADFGEFTKSLLKDIAAQIIQFQLLSIIRGLAGIPSGPSTAGGGAASGGGGIAGLLGFAKGGVMPGKMNAYANGGIANSPQLAVFGEGRGAEAFVPLPDGKNIPVKMQGGGGGGNTINISMNAIDAKSGLEFLQMHSKEIGTEIANQIEAGANRKLIKAVGR